MEGVEEQKEKTEGENEISVSATEKKMDNAAVAASEEKKEEGEEEEEEEDTKKNGKKRKAQDKDILDNRLDYQKHKCDELKAQLKKLENGTSSDFLEQSKSIDEKFACEMSVINMRRQRHIDATSKLYDFDVHAAENVAKDLKEELKQDLRRSLMEQIKMIDHTIKYHISARRTSKRRLRSKTKSDEESAANGEGPNKYANPETCVEVFKRHFSLPAEDVDKDMKEIADNWHKSAVEFRRSQDFISVIVERGRLRYDDWDIERGTFVLVQSEANQTQERGHITAIRKKEIHLKSKNGHKWQIRVEHLRTGRVHLFRGDTPT